jgi:PIN like domain
MSSVSKRSRHDLRVPEFFTDRNLGAEIVPKALEDHGLTVYRMVDFYGEELSEADDVEWIEEVTEQGLVILTKDKRIRRREAEKEAVIRSGAKMFCLKSGKLTGQEMAERFVQQRHRIIQRCQKDGPFIYDVLADRLELVVS